MTEHDALSDGHNTIHVREGLELVLFVATHHIILFDVIQALLFPGQPNNDWVWNYSLSKFHYFFIVRCKEQKYLAIFGQGPKNGFLVTGSDNCMYDEKNSGMLASCEAFVN